MHVAWTTKTCWNRRSCPNFSNWIWSLVKDTYLLFCNAILIPFSQCYRFIIFSHKIKHVSKQNTGSLFLSFQLLFLKSQLGWFSFQRSSLVDEVKQSSDQRRVHFSAQKINKCFNKLIKMYHKVFLSLISWGWGIMQKNVKCKKGKWHSFTATHNQR